MRTPRQARIFDITEFVRANVPDSANRALPSLDRMTDEDLHMLASAINTFVDGCVPHRMVCHNILNVAKV